jgi:hypothetical protein
MTVNCAYADHSRHVMDAEWILNEPQMAFSARSNSRSLAL